MILSACPLIIMNKHSISNATARRKLGALASRPKPKPDSSISQHTSKIEEKLARLKSEIDHKKRTSTRGSTRTPRQANTKEETGIAQADQKMREFLGAIGMEMYEAKMVENAVDSFEILAECKQKQLQEMGIPKGHALKIIVHLKKKTAEGTRQSTAASKSGNRQNKPKDQQPQKPHQQPSNKALEIVIQTEDVEDVQPIRKRRYFCLYCYQTCDKQFCGEDCRQSYDGLFKKYEDNLKKTESMFGKKKSLQEDDEPEQEDIDVIDYLTEIENAAKDPTPFNTDLYEEALLEITAASGQPKVGKINLEVLSIEDDI